MFKKASITSLMMVSIFMLASPSWALDLVPGQYEITSIVEMPGAPSSVPPQTVNQCITQQSPVPNKGAANQECKVTRIDRKENTVSWEMECVQQGQTMKSTGQITYRGDTFQGTTQINLGPQAGNMSIITKISGKRVGDCK